MDVAEPLLLKALADKPVLEVIGNRAAADTGTQRGLERRAIAAAEGDRAAGTDRDRASASSAVSTGGRRQG